MTEIEGTPGRGHGAHLAPISWLDARLGSGFFAGLRVCLARSLRACSSVLVLLVAIALSVAYPNLPEIGGLKDYRPKLPMRIYSADNVCSASSARNGASSCRSGETPKVMQDAVLAIEDSRFYHHGGVDYIGVMRAGLAQFRESRSQGASTITMQVARNFYLSTEKTFTRKIYEILLALKIESQLTKDQILELYMNQIYLGQRAYGFSAASEIYFGKALKDITVAEAAMLAGLPKAPSAYNPIANPNRAQIRQHYIIDRMLETGFITQEQHDPAEPETVEVSDCRGSAGTCGIRGRDGAPAGIQPLRRRGLCAWPQRLHDGAYE